MGGDLIVKVTGYADRQDALIDLGVSADTLVPISA
jgi:hypothetical protein